MEDDTVIESSLVFRASKGFYGKTKSGKEVVLFKIVNYVTGEDVEVGFDTEEGVISRYGQLKEGQEIVIPLKHGRVRFVARNFRK